MIPGTGFKQCGLSPPGFYGPPDAMTAINTLPADAKLALARFDGMSLDLQPLRPAEPVDLRPALMGLAFVLFLLDALASLWIAGFRRPGGGGGARE